MCSTKVMYNSFRLILTCVHILERESIFKVMVKFMRTEMAKAYAQTCEVFQSNWIMYPIYRVWSNIKKHHLFENIQSGRTFDKTT